MLAMKLMQGWDSGNWQAAAAIGTLLVAIVAAVIALVQIHQARRLREEQAAPYVIAQLESSEVAASFIDFVVENIGRTSAFDIKLKIDPPMVRATEVPTYAFMDARVIANSVRMLAPNQEIRMHFDTAIERFAKGLPSVYAMTVYAKDSKGRKLPDGNSMPTGSSTLCTTPRITSTRLGPRSRTWERTSHPSPRAWGALFRGRRSIGNRRYRP